MLVASGYDDDVLQIGEKIAKLTGLQAKDLLSYLKDEYNICPPDSGQVQEETKDEIIEESTIFDVVLKEVDPTKRVGVIKVLRTLTGLGLMEAKTVLDNLPKVLKESISKEDAEKIKKEIEEAGGKIELK